MFSSWYCAGSLVILDNFIDIRSEYELRLRSSIRAIAASIVVVIAKRATSDIGFCLHGTCSADNFRSRSLRVSAPEFCSSNVKAEDCFSDQVREIHQLQVAEMNIPEAAYVNGLSIIKHVNELKLIVIESAILQPY